MCSGAVTASSCHHVGHRALGHDGHISLVIVSVHDQVSKCRKITDREKPLSHLPDLPPAVGARAARHEVELDVRIVEAAVGELGGHPRQALGGN